MYLNMWRTAAAYSGRSRGVFSIRAFRISNVTWTLLNDKLELAFTKHIVRGEGGYIPISEIVDIVLCPLKQKVADFLKLAPAGAGIVEQVAQLTRVGLDLDIVLLVTRVAFQDQDLVLGAALLTQGMHFNDSTASGEQAADGRQRTRENDIGACMAVAAGWGGMAMGLRMSEDRCGQVVVVGRRG